MKGKRVLAVFFFLGLGALVCTFRTGTLSADSLENLAKAMEGYDIYDSLQKFDWKVPKPRISNGDLYKISEAVVSHGYRYFWISPEIPEDMELPSPELWQWFLGDKEVVVIAKEEIPKNAKQYLWDAKDICRRGRILFGYRNEKERTLRKTREELKASPEDINSLSARALALSESAKYEEKGLTDYFETLKQLVRTKLKQGVVLNLDTDLGVFMDAAICLDRESEYRDVLKLMPPAQAKVKEFAQKRYDSYRKASFSDQEGERKERCRVHGFPSDLIRQSS